MSGVRSTVRRLAGFALGMAAAVGCQAIQPPGIPVIPPVVAPEPVPPPVTALGTSPFSAPTALPPPTVWQKLGFNPARREAKRRMLCETPFGKLTNKALMPISKLSGGLIKPFCSPIPSLQELLAPGPVGAQAKLKMDKLNAPKRKEAVKALKEADCHYWPEAEDALIAALRADRNEGVRYTAAQTLGAGKCCTKKTVEALSISATAGDKDGAPCETSPLVRAAAAAALENCIRCLCNRPPCGDCPDEKKPPEETPRTEEQPKTSDEEKPKAPPPDTRAAWAKPGPAADTTAGDTDDDTRLKAELKAYYAGAKKKTTDEVAAAGRAALAKAKANLETVPPAYDTSDFEAAGVELETKPQPAEPRPANLLDAVASAPPPTPMPSAAPQPPPSNLLARFQRAAPALTPEPVGPVASAVSPRPDNLLDMLVRPAAKPEPAVAPADRVQAMLRGQPAEADLVAALDTLSADDVAGRSDLTGDLVAVATTATADVRAACVRALARGKLDTPAVQAVYRQAAADPSAIVRAAVPAGGK